jgi:hypothetical protein
MIKSEYKRYITSKFNIVLLIGMFACALLSVMSSLQEYADWSMQLMNPADDLNVAMVEKLVNGYSGVTLVFDFFVSNSHTIFVLVLLCGLGVITGSVAWKNLNNGFGNLVVTRIKYKRYITDLLIAQACYIVTLITAFFVLFCVIAIVLYPPNLAYGVTSNYMAGNTDFARYIPSGIVQYFLLLIFIIPVMLITSLITIYVKNRFLIQAIPLLIYIVPLLIASTIGNFSDFLAYITGKFVADNYLRLPYEFFNTDTPIQDIVVQAIALPVLLFILVATLYTKDRKSVV